MVIHHRRGFYLCPAIKSTRIGCQNFQTYRPTANYNDWTSPA